MGTWKIFEYAKKNVVANIIKIYETSKESPNTKVF